jgi:hypothetical protein
MSSMQIPADAAPEVIKRHTFAQDKLFRRDLAEVHLLIDYVSGRVDKSLSDLKGIFVTDRGGHLRKATEAQEIVEEICRISYPPNGGVESSAQQAAMLLAVKDQLNRIANPARGLTVAFTSMFAGVSLSDRNLLLRLKELFRGHHDDSGEPFFSARAAYPNLEAQARRFRRFYLLLPLAALSVIALVVWINWDISVTSTIIEQVKSAESEYGAFFAADRRFYPTAEACRSATGNDQVICVQVAVACARKAVSHGTLRDLLGSSNYAPHPIALAVHFFQPTMSSRPSDPNQATICSPPRTRNGLPNSEPSRLVGLTLSIIQGFNTILVPTLFGAIGTIAGLLRSLTAKVRDSVLAPRDYAVAQVVLFLGMVAGLAVGLFYDGSDVGKAVSNGGSGTISVSAAGLSFLAGFGAEAFFTFLDGLLAKVFQAHQASGSSTDSNVTLEAR